MYVYNCWVFETWTNIGDLFICLRFALPRYHDMAWHSQQCLTTDWNIDHRTRSKRCPTLVGPTFKKEKNNLSNCMIPFFDPGKMLTLWVDVCLGEWMRKGQMLKRLCLFLLGSYIPVLVPLTLSLTTTLANAQNNESEHHWAHNNKHECMYRQSPIFSLVTKNIL